MVASITRSSFTTTIIRDDHSSYYYYLQEPLVLAISVIACFVLFFLLMLLWMLMLMMPMKVVVEPSLVQGEVVEHNLVSLEYFYKETLREWVSFCVLPIGPLSVVIFVPISHHQNE